MMPWPPRGDERIDWGDDPPEPPPPPTGGRSFRLGFSAVYDYIGSSLAASLLAFVAFYTVLAVVFSGLLRLLDPRAAAPDRSTGLLIIAVALVAGPLVLAPLTVGLYTLARAMVRRDDPHVADIFRGAARHARPALALGYFQTFTATILVSDILWLLARPGIGWKVAGVAVAYMALFWAMAATYQWPLLLEQGKPLFTTLKRSALLAAAAPFYTLAFALVTLALMVAPVVVFFRVTSGPAVLVPVSLFWGALLPALHTAATLELLRRFDALTPEPD